MRHLKRGRKLSRRKGTREALITNLTRALIKNGKLVTTEAKAKEVVPIVEKLITVAKKDNLQARRKILALISDEKLTQKVIGEYKEKYKNRTGGYLRIYKLSKRLGDAAPQVRVEFV